MNEISFIDIINKITLFFVLAFFYARVVHHRQIDLLWGKIMVGVLFGMAAVIDMLYPVIQVPGFTLDGRSILFGTVGFFGGWISALVAALITVAILAIQNSIGTWMSLGVIISSAGIGVIFNHYRCRFGGLAKPLQLYFFGLLIHLCMVGWMQILPSEAESRISGVIIVPVILIYPVVVMMLCLLMVKLEKENLSILTIKENEAKLTAMYDHAVLMAGLLDKNGIVTYANKSSLDFAGCVLADVVGKPFHETIWWKDMPDLQEEVRSMVLQAASGEFVKIEMQYCHPARGEYVFDFSLNPVVDASGKIDFIVPEVWNITEIKRIEKALKLSEERLKFALDGAADAIWDWNIISGEIYFSPRFNEMLGYEPCELLMDFKTWEELWHPDDCQKTNMAIQELLQGRQEEFTAELRLKRKDGSYAWILSRAMAVERDDENRIIRVSGTHSDITLRKEFDEHMKYMTFYDVLTGLFNRSWFDVEMECLDRRRSGMVGLMIFDIDGLKLINDIFGYDQGDSLLQAAAMMFRRLFRISDIIARIGGDEFAVILPEAGFYDLEKLYKRVQEEVEKEILAASGANACLLMSLSCGYEASPDPSVHMMTLFHLANDRMYRDKSQRKNKRIVSSDHSLQQILIERDFGAGGHFLRLENLCSQMADILNMQQEEKDKLILLARYHDIGKIGISDELQTKSGLLTFNENIDMQRHSEIGHRLAQTYTDLTAISDWILHHHERWDGGGYPLHLRGEEIPLASRVFSILDAFDAMTSQRPYRKVISRQEALTELKRCSGSQFDPYILDIFINMEANFAPDMQLDN